MDSGKLILHTGVVESFADGLARVRIFHGGKCGTCTAKGGCPSASLGEDGQTVDVHFDGDLSVGQEVNVALRARTDILAIVLAFGVPIVLLTSIVIAATQAGFGQVASGLAAIGSVMAYLGIMALLRKNLQKKFELMIVR